MCLIAGCATVPATTISSGRFQIALIGDTHYDAVSTAQFPNLMADLDRANLAFVVHVGDIGMPTFGSCKDETYYRRREEFNQSRHPFFYTPGDNEWTDCHEAGIPDSLERLAKLREVFFARDRTLGQSTMAVGRQSADPRYAKFRENFRWTLGEVLFITLHMPGSNNNLGRTPEMDAEYSERNAANMEWMREGFRYAKQNGIRAIMILTQANPKFENSWPARRRQAFGIAPPPKTRSGYAEFLAELLREVLAYDKPVVLVHGDTHYFRIDKPLILNDKSGGGRGRIVEHFTRVELFGYPSTHWVEATVDPADPNVFSFAPRIVIRNIGGSESK